MSKENITFQIDSDRKAALDVMPSLREASPTAGYAYAVGMNRAQIQ
ncbi:MAG: hypothetical protein RMY29_001605 [Nostoc sp. CreGUA01]|nr:hypothetical protein [Nostoc sp. CreGUA01]